MEYFNMLRPDYLEALKAPAVGYRFKLQPLDHYENAVGELTAEICTQNTLQLTVGGGNVRRTASLSFFNGDGAFTPSKSSDFWYCRKFRLLAGVLTGNDIHWQSQGVFYCTGASDNGGILTVSGVDKFGLWSGELGLGRCPRAFTTDIAAGDIFIADLVRDILALDAGNGLPFDPIPPIIDPFFETVKLYADLPLNAGQCYGELLTALAQRYGADVFYDRQGRLSFLRKPGAELPSWYARKGYAAQFEKSDIFTGRSIDHRLDGANIITVSTDNTEGEIYSYTAKNTNPESPLCIQSVGKRWADEPVVYISMGDTTRETPDEKCRQYAEYLLMKQTANTVSETFAAALMPHLDVDDVIRVGDDDRLVTGIAADYAAKTMQITACSLNYLPEYGLEV